MKKLFTVLLILIIISFLSLVSAQTIVPGGYVSGVWNTGGSPYLIQGEITVHADSTLNIEPSVEVNFQGHYKFIVNGFLEAMGTESDSILFTAADTVEGWHGLRFINAPDSSHLSLCIIQYGVAPGAHPDCRGGGIYCDRSSPSISHCTISENHAKHGGGIACYYSSNPNIEKCNIRGNSAVYNGGGILCGYNSNATITNCNISDNLATYGGGIICSESNSIINHCTISGNSAEDYGGGIACTYGANPNISHCTISGNFGGVGGGIYCRVNSDPTISYCTITGNSADGGGGIGIEWDSHPTISRCSISGNSAIYCGGGIICKFNSSMSLSYSTINGNSGDLGGGGIYCFEYCYPNIRYSTICGNSATGEGGGISGWSYSGLIISNCTISRNSGADGGAIYFNRSALIIVNSIVVGNDGNAAIFSDDPDPPNSISITSGDFYDNEGGDFAGDDIPPLLGELFFVNANGDSCDVFSNIYLDPSFVYPDQNDFRLQWGSPCIDAGDPYSPLDPDGTICDMGAFYYDQSMPLRVLLTPHNTPIQVPPGGDSFDYTIWLTNIDPLALVAEVWCDATLPNGHISGPVLGPVSVDISSGATLSRARTQNVPGGAPVGTYSYNAYATAGTDTSTDNFAFVKLGADGSNGLSGWWNTGESFEDWSSMSEAESVLPEYYSLSQNYPNPFNPTTTIGYQLTAYSFVELGIYDIKGREVARLVNGFQSAGTHQAAFDGSDLSSGVYFARLQADGFSQTRKLLLIK